MRLFFICAHAVAVYADWYTHIHMKPHRRIRIVYADMQISAYAEKPHTLIWKVNSSVPLNQINDFENVNCTNCGCSSVWSNDLIPHNQPHSECKPLSLSIPLIEFLETTTAHWFLSLDQRGKWLLPWMRLIMVYQIITSIRWKLTICTINVLKKVKPTFPY